MHVRLPNRLAFKRAVERFLARHLGGRDGGDVLDSGVATGPAGEAAAQ